MVFIGISPGPNAPWVPQPAWSTGELVALQDHGTSAFVTVVIPPLRATWRCGRRQCRTLRRIRRACALARSHDPTAKCGSAKAHPVWAPAIAPIACGRYPASMAKLCRYFQHRACPLAGRAVVLRAHPEVHFPQVSRRVRRRVWEQAHGQAEAQGGGQLAARPSDEGGIG